MNPPNMPDHLRLAGRLMISLALLFAPALLVAGASSQTPVIHVAQASPDKRAAVETAVRREHEKTAETKPPSSNPGSRAPQKFTHEGVAAEFSIEPVSAHGIKSPDLLEGEDYSVSFKISDKRTGTPLTGLHPSAWMDLRDADKLTGGKDCRQKIQAFLQASLASRPEIDLNTYYILALNEDSNISVIDPLMGYGSSKLLTMVMLKSPGGDWALAGDKKHLFVTMPKSNQVAVVDTSTWKVVNSIDTGKAPTRILFQQDQRYLWVGCDSPVSGEGGVTVIDTFGPRAAAFIKTGAGHHEIAFNSDDRYAFVTNKQDGTLSVIDVQKLIKVKDLKIGEQPSSIAFSNLSKAIYVANEADGTIAVVGGPNQEILKRLTAAPGLKSIRLVQDGRWGFVVSSKENAVYIFDSSTNQLIHTIEVGESPDKITFTKDYAYVRSLASEHVHLIQLDAIGKSRSVPVLDFPGGQKHPGQSTGQSVADSIVAAPEGGSVLVANPADKMIYYYTEGMAAPMGSFQNYSREPRAVMVWDRSLREVRPGIYSTTVKLTANGDFDVAFMLDAPRMVNCFDISVKPNPELRKKDERTPIFIQTLIQDTKIRTREEYKFRFKVIDTKTNQPKDGIKDVGVLVFLAPGIWQNRHWARGTGDGAYEVAFTPPKPGVYYVFVHCPSLNVKYNQLSYVVLEAKD